MEKTINSPEKTKRNQKIIAFGGMAAFVILLVGGMWLTDPNAGKPSPMEVARERSKEVISDYTGKTSDTISAEELWIERSEKRFTELQLENKALMTRLDELAKQMAANPGGLGNQKIEASPSGIPGIGAGGRVEQVNPPGKNDVIGQSVVNTAASLVNQPLPPPPVVRRNNAGDVGVSGGQPTGNTVKKESIQVVTLTAPGSKDKKKKHINSYLPVGTFATVILLSGMDAPTGGQAKTNPVPVLMRVMDKGQLPNYFNSDIDDCHVTGAGVGNISDERMYVRTEMISCILVNGEIVQEKLLGYIAGEDGKAGFRGRIQSKQGALLARSLMAGMASGLGTSITDQYQQVSTSALGSVASIEAGKALENGLAVGTANALEKIADFYIERANETYPIIEIDANRIGELILNGGTDFNTDLVGNTGDRE